MSGRPPPARGKTGTDSRPARTWLLPEQVKRLKRATLDQYYTSLQDRDHAIVELLYDSGVRVGELVLLDVENLLLDEDPPVLRMQASIQKGGGPGPAELELDWDTGTTLDRYLTRRPWDTDALFPSRQADRMTASSVRRAVKNAAERAGVSPYVSEDDRLRGEPSEVTPHTLRHSVAYRMINEEGKRMVDVQMRLRHADLQTTTRVYGHLRRR